MPSPSHDVLVQALRDDPTLLISLLARATGLELPGSIGAMDSTVRFSRSAEMRPDLVVRVGETWIACEVQNRIDTDKGRRWLLGTAALHDGSRQMGELVVITASPRVARWAREVAHVRGPIGTTLRLSPLVLLLDAGLANKLLDARVPELALCAAWAMKHRRGPRARAVVERAFEITRALPLPLRSAQIHAILSVLSAELRAHLERIMINPDQIHESPAHRRLRLLLEEQGRVHGRTEGRTEGRAEGRAEMLLLVLETRGFSVTADERERICGCIDPDQLATWARQAVTAKSVSEALANGALHAPAPSPRAKRRRKPNGG